MTTKPYSELLEQVEALAGATLATAERSRVKIFANRRARHAHRECPYWPRFLRVGEERIVSDTGLLPLEQTGLDTIDQIIRIHAQDPFKQDAAFEYTEYYHDSTGIQITGYQPADFTGRTTYTVDGTLNPDLTGLYAYASTDISGNDIYENQANSDYRLIGLIVPGTETIDEWYLIDANTLQGWTSGTGVLTPDLATSWTPFGSETGTVSVTGTDLYGAYITYIAAPADTYGDGEGEEDEVPEEWFEYMAQGAYADWLRSDGQTEKALAEEVIAEKLLNQQLEKVSRQNGNQVITRQLSHGNMQWR